MLHEIAHFFRHMPGVARLSTKMSQAELYDVLAGRLDESGMAQWRTRLADGLTGRVLEIGCGTGAMFPHYAEDVAVTGIEPAENFLERARPLADASPAEITLQIASAEELPFEDASFDAVIVAAVLCSVKSVQRSLAEISRVLKPGGEMRAAEHVRSPRAIPGALMWLVNPLWRAYNRQGCNMHRRTGAAIEAAGFRIVEVKPFQIYTPGLPAFPSLYLRAIPK